ncbi:MAG: cob(I)yrinic acid a,c-diamide adenosyltransferase [Deltaproteobacteria bacterium]|nr:cob(I)yrinic acid a,c-diamide adenosyltransferase [Deltaproteobacteria bacterium]
MVKINRVYTRTGDQGNTSLVGGRKTVKDDPRVECFGTVDELNCILGLALSFNTGTGESPERKLARERLSLVLQVVQQRLFDLGAELATHPEDRYAGQPLVGQPDVDWLERVIDTLNEDLEPLISFILPGGGPVSAFLHQARAVCRRAERLAVSLGRQEALGAFVVPYLNRLSDALFVLSRWVAARLGEREVLWQPGLTTGAWPPGG